MNPKISQALALLTGCPASDFAELAILAADQAGMSEGDQQDMRSTLFPTCHDCGSQIDGYVPTAADRKLAPGTFCEPCHGDRVRFAKRQRSRDIEDGRGDYMRDMQRGAL